MSIDALTLASLCEAIYQPAGEFSSIVQSGDVYAGVTLIGGKIVVVCRGSVNVSDWLHDLEAYPKVVDGIGTVHEGMWDGIEDFFSRLHLKKGDSVAFAGHSLGCAHAAFAARLALASGVSVSQLTLFAPPRFGDAVFHAGISSIQTRAWRNGLDPVPSLPNFGPWEQFELNRICIQPEDPWDPIAWHAMSLYVQGISHA